MTSIPQQGLSMQPEDKCSCRGYVLKELQGLLCFLQESGLEDGRLRNSLQSTRMYGPCRWKVLSQFSLSSILSLVSGSAPFSIKSTLQ